MEKKFSILYVDDEESNLRIFKNTFRREYNVHSATSAKAGMEILEKENIHVILSDQRMREMTGVEFLKYTFEKYPQLNRILITGFTDFVALQSAVNDAKIFQYIQKPWKEKVLRTAIEEALKVYKLEQENKKLAAELRKKNEKLANINKDLKNTNEKLFLAKRKAEESDRLKTVFFNNISHEIRTPMNSIIGFSKILKMPELTSQQKKEYIDIVVGSSEQLMGIIDDIIEVSQLTSSKIKVGDEVVDINSFLNKLIAIYKSEKSEKISLSLINEIDEKDSRIISEEFKLYKILSNLIDNALKYTHEGYVNVSCKKVDDCIEFSVEDSGIGISQEMQDVIFDRFRQEDENLNRQFGGLGLGLFIVRENVKLLNGEVVLKSEKGKGTTFLFRIPYKSADETIESIQEEETKKEIISLHDKYSVLIVEDEKFNSMFLETILIRMNPNIKILNAEDGQEAVDICRENSSIDLVLMDIKMPRMNGLEATSQIRKFRKKLPIIAQSAYTMQEDKEKAKLAGCNDFITKPIDEDALAKIITKYRIEVNK